MLRGWEPAGPVPVPGRGTPGVHLTAGLDLYPGEAIPKPRPKPCPYLEKTLRVRASRSEFARQWQG